MLTPRTERDVRGRKCWVPLWVVTFAGLYIVALIMVALKWSEDGLCGKSWWCVTKMYICTFVAALLWVVYLWRSTAPQGEVPLSLLITIWFTAGTISVGCCSLCNWLMVQLWAWMNPYCYITYPADRWPWEYTSTKCMLINVVQWILTAGIIEEGFKFASLLRLRSTTSQIRDSIDNWRGCRCPGRARWWLKLADSPLAIALCGIAAGGGLATTENFMYIFSSESIDKAFKENDLESAYGRIAASFAHMVWTGYAACGLARWEFLPPGDPTRPRRKTSYLVAPIILHGLYNWCSTMQKCEAHEQEYKGKLYKSDGCYLPPSWRMAFKVAHTTVMLYSFYIWHTAFSEIAGEGDEEENSGAAFNAAVEAGLANRGGG